MREVETGRISEGATFAACLATILELPLDAVPEPAPAEDVAGWRVSRWLGGRPGARSHRRRREILMARSLDRPRRHTDGRPSCGRHVRRPVGCGFDPGAAASQSDEELLDGFVIAASDIALARPQPTAAPTTTGRVEAIFVAPGAARPRVNSSPRSCSRVTASTATGT